MSTKAGRGGPAPGVSPSTKTSSPLPRNPGAAAGGASTSATSSQQPQQHQQQSQVQHKQQQQQQQQQQKNVAAQDLTPYLGTPLRLTLTGQEDKPVIGLLFAHDASSGVVILETGAYPYPDYPSKAAAAPTKRRHQAVISAIGGFSRRDPTGFRIIKERTINEVELLSQRDVNSGGVSSSRGFVGLPPALPKKLSEVQPVDLAVAEKREIAASKEAQLRAGRIGVGVSELAQDVFEALSKTLPCRWHDKHIIVMDEVVLSEPYDASSLRVPKYSLPLLERLIGTSSQVSPEELPDKESITTAKGKARSWERVQRVLEGERKKIEQRKVTGT